ncbi:hypothetical protein LSG31_00580 [Fodinisporobacter ferrooxydans]|uniref:Ead/Ea22-like family protein n=1 Tax=Fodinisporobacter ferrooxydans TaxID=2901836 RepID=A0ABY4CLF0_9BACL|nr:hypothetical protein LSG31_00580 [Alicyclobacillaceae bacterium MYW30-H2]
MSEHKPITDQELNEILARCEAATPGPWMLHGNEGTKVIIAGDYAYQEKPDLIIDICSANNDDIFISHAREDVPRLAAEVKRLKAENERLQQVLKQISSFRHCCDDYRGYCGAVEIATEALEGDNK